MSSARLPAIAWVAALIVGGLFPACARAQLVFSDIPYESPGGIDISLDVWWPDGGPIPGMPTIYYAHGGGFMAGDKSDKANYLARLTDWGFTAVSVNYTVATTTRSAFPQAVLDCKNALRWVKTTGHALYGLSRTVVVTGSSAGGYMSLMLGLTDGVAEFETLSPPPGGYRVAAVFNLWGPTDLIWHWNTGSMHNRYTYFIGAPYGPDTHDLYVAACPISYVDPCDPPAGLLHGDMDATIPYEMSVMLDEQLSVNGVYSDLVILPGGTHGFPSWGRQAAVADLVAMMTIDLLDHSINEWCEHGLVPRPLDHE